MRPKTWPRLSPSSCASAASTAAQILTLCPRPGQLGSDTGQCQSGTWWNDFYWKFPIHEHTTQPNITFCDDQESSQENAGTLISMLKLIISTRFHEHTSVLVWPTNTGTWVEEHLTHSRIGSAPPNSSHSCGTEFFWWHQILTQKALAAALWTRISRTADSTCNKPSTTEETWFDTNLQPSKVRVMNVIYHTIYRRNDGDDLTCLTAWRSCWGICTTPSRHTRSLVCLERGGAQQDLRTFCTVLRKLPWVRGNLHLATRILFVANRTTRGMFSNSREFFWPNRRVTSWLLFWHYNLTRYAAEPERREQRSGREGILSQWHVAPRHLVNMHSWRTIKQRQSPGDGKQDEDDGNETSQPVRGRGVLNHRPFRYQAIDDVLKHTSATRDTAEHTHNYKWKSQDRQIGCVHLKTIQTHRCSQAEQRVDWEQKSLFLQIKRHWEMSSTARTQLIFSQTLCDVWRHAQTGLLGTLPCEVWWRKWESIGTWLICTTQTECLKKKPHTITTGFLSQKTHSRRENHASHLCMKPHSACLPETAWRTKRTQHCHVFTFHSTMRTRCLLQRIRGGERGARTSKKANFPTAPSLVFSLEGLGASRDRVVLSDPDSWCPRGFTHNDRQRGQSHQEDDVEVEKSIHQVEWERLDAWNDTSHSRVSVMMMCVGSSPASDGLTVHSTLTHGTTVLQPGLQHKLHQKVSNLYG